MSIPDMYGQSRAKIAGQPDIIELFTAVKGIDTLAPTDVLADDGLLPL